MLSACVKFALVLSLGVVATPAPKAPIAPKAPKASQTTLGGVEQAMLDAANAQRARYGLAALKIAPQLEQTTRRHAAWMTNSHNMQHSSIGVAENIAWGQRSTQEVMVSWMNSPGHRANILNPGYHWIGVAAYTATDGSCYWCQQFLR